MRQREFVRKFIDGELGLVGLRRGFVGFGFDPENIIGAGSERVGGIARMHGVNLLTNEGGDEPVLSQRSGPCLLTLRRDGRNLLLNDT
jgi:hypothetical protein